MADDHLPEPAVTLDLRSLRVTVDDQDGTLRLIATDGDTTVILDPGLSGSTSREAIEGAEWLAGTTATLVALMRTRAGHFRPLPEPPSAPPPDPPETGGPTLGA